jgi:glycosyltransferase involved in cell wall biosynthesis
LSGIITLKGNQTAETVKKAYQKSHFLVLPSKSEGWPKVVAEAMFWGCLPLATPVSCVPNMLDDEERGLLLTMDVEQDMLKFRKLIVDSAKYQAKTNAALKWSRDYTIDKFESEIKQLFGV